MARVICRCGEKLEVDRGGPERVVCPRCQARIRVRRAQPGEGGDGLIRFHCRCGRRLKVRAAERPEAGRCPDCGTVVPVPKPEARPAATVPLASNAGAARAGFDDDARTQDMDAAELARLQRWAARHGVLPGGGSSTAVPPPSPPAEASYSPPPSLKVEAGLRICPRCRRPLHMSATTCRACGASTPKP